MAPAEFVELALLAGVTVLPLLGFVHGARAVPMVFLGWSQYLAPSLMLAVAVLLQGYKVPGNMWLSFGLIWLGIGAMTAGGRFLTWFGREPARTVPLKASI